MAECIDRVEYCEKHCRCSNEYCDRQSCPIWRAPAADVAPVVRCEDCENSYYAVDDLICSYGPCVDCPVSPDFWCANGRRREDAHAQD